MLSTRAILALMSVVMPVVAQDAGAQARLPFLWNAEVRRHVASALIVRGVVRVDPDRVAAAAEKGGHVEVTIDVHEMVHGKEAASVQFRHFVPERGKARPEIRPSPDDLLALDGQDRVVFLSTVDGVNYLVATDGTGVVEPEQALLAGLKRREVLHRRLLGEKIPQDPARQEEVARILRGATNDREAQRLAFAALEDLGCAALPEIVAAMDDRRQLPVRELSLTNRAEGAFEAVRHYQPKRVVDGISAVLNQLTGESFGFLANGARDEERAIAVEAWTIYVHYQLAARATDRSGR